MSELTVIVKQSRKDYPALGESVPERTITLAFDSIETLNELEEILLLVVYNMGFPYIKSVACIKEGE